MRHAQDTFLLLLWGAPAAGKSTLTELLLDRLRRAHHRPVCHLGTDSLNQTLLGPCFDPEIRPALYEGLLNMVEGSLAVRRSVLVEGTFLDPTYRGRLWETATRLRIPIFSVSVHCGLPSRLERNRRRSAEALVPNDYLLRSHRNSRAQFGQAHLLVDTEQLSPQQAADLVLESLEHHLQLHSPLAG